MQQTREDALTRVNDIGHLRPYTTEEIDDIASYVL
jgi:hypothetical protein